MKKVMLVILIVFGLQTNCLSQGEIIGGALGGAGSVLSGVIMGNAMKSMGDKIKAASDAAGQQGNYAVLNAADKANLLFQNIFYMLDKQLGKRFEQLSLENQKLVATLYAVVDQLNQLPQDILEIENFLAIDIQNFINQLPFKDDKYLLRNIKGFSLIYQQKGFYSISITGGAFLPGNNYDVTINGKNIPIASITSQPPYTIRIDIPTTNVNDLFRDDDVTKCPIQIKCYAIKKGNFFSSDRDREIFEFKDDLYLLPKKPVKYQFIKHTITPGWSDEEFESQMGIGTIAATGEEKVHRQGYVEAEIPKGCLMLKDKYTLDFTPKNGHFWWQQGPIYSNEDTKIVFWGDHEIHDQPTFMYLKVKYKKPKNKVTKITAKLYDKDEIAQDALAFGTYISPNGDENIETYDFKATLFNGKEIYLTPLESSKEGVEIYKEVTSSQSRYIVKINPPKK